jgi:5-methylcytosine-specific restriction endonuclease McrA
VPGDREKARARQRRYVAAHRSIVNARNAERDRLNPEAKRERVRRRRARLKGATVERVDYRAILAEHGRLCHLCELPIDGAIDFDHVIPISKGGAHVADNIRPSHPFCNRRKGATLPLVATEREAA